MISIIMPLYNAERFLGETLQSIQKQTYHDFELICINDASTDATMDILQSVQEHDTRIKIYSNKERSGAAKSRNIGISKAKGEYITFLDGDDIFEEEMLELGYEAAKKEELDIVIYEYMHVDSHKIYEKKSIYRSKKYIEKYCNNPFCIAQQSPEDFLNWSMSPCNKLFRKKFIIENQLEFQTLSSSNDIFFVIMALMLAKKVVALNDRRVMVYARDHATPSRISYARDPMCGFWAMEKVLIEMDNRDILSKLYAHYYIKLFLLLKLGLSKTKDEETREKFYLFLKNEGIERLKSLGKGYFDKLDDITQNIFRRFEDEEYESKWYERESIFELNLKKNADKVIKELNNYASIAVWGTGVYGQAVLRFCRVNNVKISGVIDSDEKKQGKMIEGISINAPEIVLPTAQVVLLSFNAIDLKFYEELCKRNIVVLDSRELWL